MLKLLYFASILLNAKDYYYYTFARIRNIKWKNLRKAMRKYMLS